MKRIIKKKRRKTTEYQILEIESNTHRIETRKIGSEKTKKIEIFFLYFPFSSGIETRKIGSYFSERSRGYRRYTRDKTK